MTHCADSRLLTSWTLANWLHACVRAALSEGCIQIESPVHISLSPNCVHSPRLTICSLENSLRAPETTYGLLSRKILDVSEIHAIFEYTSSPTDDICSQCFHEDWSRSGFRNVDEPRSTVNGESLAFCRYDSMLLWFARTSESNKAQVVCSGLHRAECCI
jgi:hypothetical protein